MELIQNAVQPVTLDLALVEATTGEDAVTFLTDMLPIFLEDMPQQLADLQQAIAAADLTTVERTAHAMKSSCAWIGATVLSGNCRDLESAARTREARQLDGLFAAIARDYAGVMLWIEEQGLI